MTEHTHTVLTEGCYRCDLNRDEMGVKRPKWAPDNADGLHAYVITKRSWGRTWDRIEYARTLIDAKNHFGYTREMYTTITVRRARPEDVKP